MVKPILHSVIISLIYLMFRTMNTPDFMFNSIITFIFIWLLKKAEESRN